MRLARNDLGTLLPSPRPAFSIQGLPESRNIAGTASLKIRFPVPKMRWHVLITLCYSHDFQQLVAMYARNRVPNGVQCIRRSARRRRTERYASQRCVEPACHTSTASWLNWCQCWSRDRRRVASSCGCVSAGVNRGANVRRTTASGDEVEGTTDVIARLVGFKFSFADGYSMRFHPSP